MSMPPGRPRWLWCIGSLVSCPPVPMAFSSLSLALLTFSCSALGSACAAELPPPGDLPLHCSRLTRSHPTPSERRDTVPTPHVAPAAGASQPTLRTPAPDVIPRGRRDRSAFLGTWLRCQVGCSQSKLPRPVLEGARVSLVLSNIG